MTGGVPYPSIQNEDLLSHLKRGERMDKPDNCSSSEVYISIIHACMHMQTLIQKMPVNIIISILQIWYHVDVLEWTASKTTNFHRIKVQICCYAPYSQREWIYWSTHRGSEQTLLSTTLSRYILLLCMIPDPMHMYIPWLIADHENTNRMSLKSADGLDHQHFKFSIILMLFILKSGLLITGNINC